MSLKVLFKNMIANSPAGLSKPLIHVPFELRLGRQYHQSRSDHAWFENADVEDLKKRIFVWTKAVAQYAQDNISFYHTFYGDHGFDSGSLARFEDISRIPILSKADLKHWPIDQRSVPTTGAMRINTGGTSGEPLEFYIDRHAFAREWAHMHSVWRQLDYKKTDCKLTFRGKNLGNQVIRYNAVHNEYVTNAYCRMEKLVREIRKVLKREAIRYLHGYPSSIYSFAEYCGLHAPDIVSTLKSSLKGILFGSEFPHPRYRKLIEATFGAPTISWYGHSEMAVLAHEKKGESFTYHTMLSYGFTEAVAKENGEYRLIGTSYHNRVHPFIRYDTGDLIKPVRVEEGILRSFHVSSGRQGEFVLDREGHRISLTALIFGRHHAAFSTVKFVQVHQSEPGKIIVRATLKDSAKNISSKDVLGGFDFSHVDMDVTCVVADAPIMTPTGKTALLIPKI